MVSIQRSSSEKFGNSGLFSPESQHDACGVGFVARLSGQPEHGLVDMAVKALERMAHRGGAGSGFREADGAGILLPMPQEFMRRVWAEELAAQSRPSGFPEVYGVGQFFMPRSASLQARVKSLAEKVFEEHQIEPVSWRNVPVREDVLDERAKNGLPHICQVLVCPKGARGDFERKLYIARRHLAGKVRDELELHPDQFHVASLSSHSIVYKGMLKGGRLSAFYQDLSQRDFKVHFAIFHERYSTNTKPAWRLAQPFHCLAHNGEINTVACNQANMVMREPALRSELFGDDIRHILPVLDPAGSDSAMLDNAMEALYMGGRSLAHSAMMLLPEPFGADFIMGDDKRAFYEYHAALMEPWDGPAALVFTDGFRRIGAMLDRNALRPCRFVQTRDGLFLLASEAGVLDIPSENVVRRGRLDPRRMLLVDFARQRVLTDAECKGRVIYEKPYRHWVREHGIALHDLSVSGKAAENSELDAHELLREQAVFGFTQEELDEVLLPMARNAQEPVASMGYDVPLAVLSEEPQLLFAYFKQRFAQVTNPPIDPIREGLVMSLTGFLGKRGNLFDETPGHYGLLRLPNPILTSKDLRRIRASSHPRLKVAELKMCFHPTCAGKMPGQADLAELGASLEAGLNSLFAQAERAVDGGVSVLLLSDHGLMPGLPVPSLLAVAGLHHHLIRAGKRHLASIIVDCGDARQIMHLAQLISFGASAVHPRIGFASVEAAARQTHNEDPGKVREFVHSYVTALQKGLLKTFSRMGVSTLRSFLGGQFFEAVGISEELAARYFESGPISLPSRIGGAGLGEIAYDVCRRALSADSHKELPEGSLYRFRKEGERHLWTPQAVRSLQKAVRENDREAYRAYAAESDNQRGCPVTLRGLLEFVHQAPIPLSDVEAEEEILRRFTGAAISFGSISPEAHEAIAIACNRLGARSNSGEGGEHAGRNLPLPVTEETLAAERKHPSGSARSRIRQIASGRFGVTAAYIVNADEIQIKMAQGAKPGEGGQLPGYKVSPEIAEVRGTTPGVTLISPPPHHDIYSIEDLAQLVYDLKQVNPFAKISVKLVSGTGIGTVACGVAKAGADIILVSGHDGGTGASPRTALDFVGLPLELGLAEAHQALVHNGLRDRVVLQADGQLRTGRDLAAAALLGAEEFGLGTALMVSLGCMMCRKCHLGACPVGIATQDEKLRAKFMGKPEHVENYLRFLASDLRERMASLGFRSAGQMQGHADRLKVSDSVRGNARLLDLSRLLSPCVPNRPSWQENEAGNGHPLFEKLPESMLDRGMREKLVPGIRAGQKNPMRFEGIIHNTNRAAAAYISGEVARCCGDDGLPPGSIEILLKGSAGQSAGAFLVRGISLIIRGEANDYVGKGLSGGTVIVAPDRIPGVHGQAQAAIGNVALYGASGGELFVGGSAGERFAVRNSGAVAVVEGLGDHGCEYMTGGVVVVLGSTGYNFAAGMSGGVAYVYDPGETFQTRCNMDGVDLESVWQIEDSRLLKDLLGRHCRLTGSPLARDVLGDWQAALPLFLKVTPIEYKKALGRIRLAEGLGVEALPVTEEVFSK